MHCSLIRKDQLERMKRLGVILELQNAFMWDKADNVERNLGLAVANPCGAQPHGYRHPGYQ